LTYLAEEYLDKSIIQKSIFSFCQDSFKSILKIQDWRYCRVSWRSRHTIVGWKLSRLWRSRSGKVAQPQEVVCASGHKHTQSVTRPSCVISCVDGYRDRSETGQGQ